MSARTAETRSSTGKKAIPAKGLFPVDLPSSERVWCYASLSVVLIALRQSCVPSAQPSHLTLSAFDPHWPLLTLRHAKLWPYHRGSHTDLLVLNIPHLGTWKTWAAIMSVLPKDRPSIKRHAGKPECTHPPEPRIYHNPGAIPTAVVSLG